MRLLYFINKYGYRKSAITIAIFLGAVLLFLSFYQGRAAVVTYNTSSEVNTGVFSRTDLMSIATSSEILLRHSASSTINSQITDANMEGYWRLDEEGGNNRNDSSANGNHLAPLTSVSSVGGKIYNAASFGGTQALKITDASQTGLNITGSVSVVGWVNKNSTNQMYLVSKIGASFKNGYWVQLYTNKIYFSVANATTEYQASSDTTLSNNQWYHFAAVFDQSADLMTVYINGVSDGTGAATDVTIGTNANAFGLGYQPTTESNYFVGSLDEVAVYSRALSADEVLDVYNAQNGNYYRYGTFVSPAQNLDSGTFGNLEWQFTDKADGSGWLKYGPDPVMSTSTSGWDSQSLGGHAVVVDDNIYKMWYSGRSASGWLWDIGYATSNDGISWTKSESNPVMQQSGSGWDSQTVYSPTILKEDGIFKMWYMGNSTGADANTNVGYATSTDGITWNKSSDNPVLEYGSSGAWDDYSIGGAKVINDSDLYHMWYSGRQDGGSWSVGHATSTDGVTWNKDPSNPVLTGTGGAWVTTHAEPRTVIKENGVFKLWYSGYSSGWKIGFATSTNGASWTKSSNNPILTVGSVWDVADVEAPSVIRDNNIYKMWYMGWYTNGGGQVGYATSTTGSVSFQTRTGATADPLDGTWESWEPNTLGQNYSILSSADIHTDWTSSDNTNFAPAEGDVTRNVDYFEDEDESTAGNLLKVTATGASSENDTITETISSSDIANYDYLGFWIYSTVSGDVAQFQFGESSASENTFDFTVDSASTWQKVFWDISDIPRISRDTVTKLALKYATATASTLYLDNVYAYKFMATSTGSTISSTPNSYFQYRAIFGAADNSRYPVSLNSVTVNYTANAAPSATFDNDFSNWESGDITANYKLIDTESGTLNISQTGSSGIEYSTDGSSWSDATDAGGSSDGLTGLSSSASPGTSHVFVWDTATDLPTTEDSEVYLRIRPNDGRADADAWETSGTFGVDNLAPSSVSAPTFGTTTSSAIDVTKPATVTEDGSGLNQWQARRDTEDELGLNATTTGYITDSSLSENTAYTYAVQFTDMQSNASAYGASSTKYTLADDPSNVTADAVSKTSITLTVDEFSNYTASSSGYYFSNDTAVTNSGWIQTNSWEDMGLSCGTSYDYTVKYRNGDAVETTTASLTQATSNCSDGGGIVTAITAPSIFSAPDASQPVVPAAPVAVVTQPPSSVVFNKDLERGTAGEDVRRLQELLAKDSEMYPERLITGFYGPLTQNAVRRFQLKHGIIKNSADAGSGRAGPITRSKLAEIFKESIQPVKAAPGISDTEVAAIQSQINQLLGQLKFLQEQLQEIIAQGNL